MNYFERILYFLQGTMDTPNSFGWFHLLWIGLVIFLIFILYKLIDKYSEKQLKLVLGIYGIVALILEILKQLIWTFSYDSILGVITYDYQWYAFPFQLCTTPIYVCLICLFLKKCIVRDAMLSYVAYITILGSLATIIMPDSCFTSDILVNIHTMWLHCGSLVVSIYLIMSGEVELKIKNFYFATIVFLILVFVADWLNIVVYNLDILNGETFNMFYISPYFVSILPVFNIIQENVPYLIYLLIYIIAIILGGLIIYNIGFFMNRLSKR